MATLLPWVTPATEPNLQSPLITSFTVTSALGRGLEATARRLAAAESGLAACRFETVDLDTFVGEVPGVDARDLPEALRRFDCRNNRLADLALATDGFAETVASASARWGAGRVGVFLGTSTAGILSTEIAYRHRDAATGALPGDYRYRETHNTSSVTEFVRDRLGLAGPALTHSTACSSSAKAFASAWRAIESGLADAAVVGGVDTLCLTTLYGFHSLGLLSPRPCRPWDANRDGISIGEGAAFFLIERAQPGRDPAPRLLGFGESCDAYHMSSPHPQGEGARAAMLAALARAGLEPGDIDYVNLHGTATPANDAAEDQAVTAVFGDRVPCSSTKGATGHTLGAAGAVEAAIALIAMAEGFVPAGLGLETPDPQLHARYATRTERRALRRTISNSFGFGGSNCSLILGAAEESR